VRQLIPGRSAVAPLAANQASARWPGQRPELCCRRSPRAPFGRADTVDGVFEPRATIDLHCHILPGLDDGARDLSDAVAMARQAQSDGIEAICATPHIRHDHAVSIADLPDRLAELRAAVAAAGIATRILAGGEVATTALKTLNLAELAAVTLGRAGRWVLLEPAPGPLDDQLDDAVAWLSARGRRALIAHPERHLSDDMIERLRRLTAAGALIQATAAALTDESTKAGMLNLARAGVLHVLGSDAHSAGTGRPVTLTPGLAVLGSVSPLAEHLDWAARFAPRGIVSGQELTAPF
jgi:protein-tyrosine phosphatase